MSVAPTGALMSLIHEVKGNIRYFSVGAWVWVGTGEGGFHLKAATVMCVLPEQTAAEHICSSLWLKATERVAMEG